jgi:hypothetical protein
MADLDQFFLQNRSLEEERFLFTFSIAWLDHWTQLEKVLPEDDLFSRLRRLQTLLGLGVAFEQTLRLVFGAGGLKENMTKLAEALGIGRATFEAGAHISPGGGDWKRDFEGTMEAVIASASERRVKSLAIMYGLRNHAAHDLAAPRVLGQHKSALAEGCIDAIMMAVWALKEKEASP